MRFCAGAVAERPRPDAPEGYVACAPSFAEAGAAGGGCFSIRVFRGDDRVLHTGGLPADGGGRLRGRGGGEDQSQSDG